MVQKKLIRISTIPLSLNILLKGQLAFANRFFEVVAISGPGIDLEQVAEREGVKVVAVKMERKISPLNDIVSLILLYQAFRRERPLIIHSITPKAGLLSMLAGRFAGVPIRIHTFTGLVFPSKKGWMQRLLIAMDKLLCFFATHVYPEGQGVLRDLQKFKITKKELKVIANGNVNGIDIEFFNPDRITETQKHTLRIELEIGQNDFVFTFVGRLVRDKGINELVRAFVSFQQSYPTSKLLLVGNIEEQHGFLDHDVLQKMKTNRFIISAGFQEDIRVYLAISKVLILPSHREGFPNVVLQAGAMGLASIVTNINGSNEIIIDKENGLIIEVNNENEIFNAMKMYFQDVNLYTRATKKSRLLIVDRYKQEEVWGATLEEYYKLIRECTKI